MNLKKWLLIVMSIFSFSMLSQPANASVSVGFFFQPMPVVYDYYYMDGWDEPYDYYYYRPVRRYSRCHTRYYGPYYRHRVRYYDAPRYRVRHRRCCDVWYD